MLALLYAHPGVYVDVAALQTPSMVPRAAYNRYLQALVEKRFGKTSHVRVGLPESRGSRYRCCAECGLPKR
jgi:hypothetical protein